MIVRPDPDTLMAGELGTWLKGQDAVRAGARAKAGWWQKSGIGAACAVAFGIVVIGGDIGLALKIGLVIGAAGFGIGEWVKRPVIRSIKGGINGAIARALDMAFDVDVTPGAEYTTAKAFQMFPNYDRSNFEDCWRGAVGAHSFLLYEANLEEERSTGKSSTWVTVFRGSIIEIGFARRFQGVTLVERAGRRKRLFGLLGDAEEIKLGGIDLARIDMVDPRFGEDFAVWSNDQVEARYLVHPEYVERLMKVEETFSGEKIRTLFTDGSLIIVLESGDLFESGSIDSSNDRRLLESTIEQFGTLVDLAATLNERPR